MNERLEELARGFGVQTSYHDIDGTLHTASEAAVCAVLRSLGAPIERISDAEVALAALRTEPLPGFVAPVLVAWDGEVPPVFVHDPRDEAGVLRIVQEDGRISPWPGARREAEHGGRRVLRHDLDGSRLPFGRHRLELEGLPGSTCTVLAAPACLQPNPDRSWGVLLPLHAYGGRTCGGVAGYDGLARACRWIGSLGGSFVSTLPLLAQFLDAPFEPSPYVPASRLFWNDFFVDPRSAPGFSAEDETPGQLRVPDSGDLVDYHAVAAVRRRVLERASERFHAHGGASDPAFQAWAAQNPRAEDYARFRAACDRWRSPWCAWPAGPRDGGLCDDDVDRATVRYHRYAAWVADTQLGRIADSAARGESAALYLDLPIGVHPDGYDVWRERALFASGVSVGAPPDPFFRNGQNWGFPPILPAVSRADGHRYLGECLRHHLRHAGALRLDHAMSLQRLYWVPDGADARDGVYVHYPLEELLALVSLEAWRQRAFIIGEDLGTVTPTVRTALDEHGIHRMYVAQFEFRRDLQPPLAAVPAGAAASVNTHDLAPFAGFLAGHDLADQHALGLMDGEALETETAERARLRSDLAAAFGVEHANEEDATARILESVHRFLATSPAALLTINLEDLWGETRPQNVPGTTTERPNWRRRASRDLDALFADVHVDKLLREIARLRTAGGHSP